MPRLQNAALRHKRASAEQALPLEMDGGPDESFSLGDDTESDEWDEETCRNAMLSSRLYELDQKDVQCEMQLKSLMQQVKRIQKLKEEAKEKAKIIQREQDARRRNVLEFGNPLPDEGNVWFCDSCRIQLAAPLCPTMCPLCETQNSVNKSKIRAPSEARK